MAIHPYSHLTNGIDVDEMVMEIGIKMGHVPDHQYVHFTIANGSFQANEFSLHEIESIHVDRVPSKTRRFL